MGSMFFGLQKLIAALLLAVPIIDLPGLGRDDTARIWLEQREGRVVEFRALMLTMPALQSHGAAQRAVRAFAFFA